MKTTAFCLLLLCSSVLFSAEINCLSMPDSNQEIVHCQKKIKDYPNFIHFYIPHNLDVSLPVQLFVHFHGHNLAGHDHFAKGYGDYGTFLLNSRANSILVIPESIGNCTTYDSFFSDQKRTTQFFSDLELEVESISSMKMSTLVLSGHSGAYRVLNRLIGYANLGDLHLKNVIALGMFDATYGATTEIVKWVQKKANENQDFLFYDAFIVGSKATAEEGSRVLEKLFKNLPENSSSSKIFFVPILSNNSENLLDQHFNILLYGSLTSFWEKASARRE